MRECPSFGLFLYKVSAADVCGSTDEFIRLPDNDNGTPANLPRGIIVGSAIDESKLDKVFGPPVGQGKLYIARIPTVFPLSHQHGTTNGKLHDDAVVTSLEGYDKSAQSWIKIAKYQSKCTSSVNFFGRYENVKKEWIPGGAAPTEGNVAQTNEIELGSLDEEDASDAPIIAEAMNVLKGICSRYGPPTNGVSSNTIEFANEGGGNGNGRGTKRKGRSDDDDMTVASTDTIHLTNKMTEFSHKWQLMSFLWQDSHFTLGNINELLTARLQVLGSSSNSSFASTFNGHANNTFKKMGESANFLMRGIGPLSIGEFEAKCLISNKCATDVLPPDCLKPGYTGELTKRWNILALCRQNS